MKSVFILLGKPGAGKGTRVSEFLEGREEQFEVLSVSDLLKKAKHEKPEISYYMNSGKLVPDEIINDLVINKILSSEKHLIADGFPRTIVQAKAMLDAGIYPNKVIHLYVDDEVILQRANDRLICENCREIYTKNNFKPSKIEGICDKCGGRLVKRSDDEPEIVRERLKVYEKETYPILAFFEKEHVRIFELSASGELAKKLFEDILIS